MSVKTLYESQHPCITITHDTITGDVVLNRADKYMRNPDSESPPFVPQCVILLNTEVEER